METWDGTDLDPTDTDPLQSDQSLEAESGTSHHDTNNQRFSRPDPVWLRKRAISGAMRNATAEPTLHASSGPVKNRYHIPPSPIQATGSPALPGSSSITELEEQSRIAARSSGVPRRADDYGMDRPRGTLDVYGHWDTQGDGQGYSVSTEDFRPVGKRKQPSEFAPGRERWRRQGVQFESDSAHALGLQQKAAQHSHPSELKTHCQPSHGTFGQAALDISSSSQQDLDEPIPASVAQDPLENTDYTHPTLQHEHTPVNMPSQQSAHISIRNDWQNFQPTLKRLSPGNNSPVARTIGDPDNWLLPRPSRHEAEHPSIIRPFSGEESNGFSFEQFPPEQSRQPRAPPRKCAPDPPRTPVMKHRTTVTGSPYFPAKSEVLGGPKDNQDISRISGCSGATGIGSSFDMSRSSSTRESSSPVGFLRVSQSDSFLSSESDIGHQCQAGPQYYSRQHQGQPSYDTSTSNDPGRSESREPLQLNSDSRYSTYSLSPESPQRDQLSPYDKPPRAYPSSVRSRGLSFRTAQTITPEPSPYSERYNSSRARGMPDGIHELQHDQRNPGHLNHGRPDSSILSPLSHGDARPTGIRSDTISPVFSSPQPRAAVQPSEAQFAARTTLGRHAGTWDIRHNGTEMASFSISDVDLGTNSDSDSVSSDDGGYEHAVLPSARQQVQDGLQLHTTTASTDLDRVVCAISQSRSSDVIGLAIVNITLGQVDITRILNDDRYQRLIETVGRMPTWPQTFLVLKKVVAEQSKSLLACCLKEQFPDSEVVPLDREHWNESEALRMLERLAWRKDIKAIRSNLEHNFYASCAFSAVSSLRSQLVIYMQLTAAGYGLCRAQDGCQIPRELVTRQVQSARGYDGA